MRALLAGYRAQVKDPQSSLGGYLDGLLAAFGQPASAAQDKPASGGEPSEGLVEPLSDRELEVLRLLAANCSNQEIAEALVVSVNTVKTHISRLYGKLGVHTRFEAVERARALHLL